MYHCLRCLTWSNSGSDREVIDIDKNEAVVQGLRRYRRTEAEGRDL
ncbi:MAG: hypothetical protein Q9M89_00595 [Persephonella sp.]|nr:hypothetical protein [Persephonella sp.]